MVIRVGVPGGGTGMIYRVLFALNLWFWAFLRRVSFRFIGMISLSAILATQLVIPSSIKGDSTPPIKAADSGHNIWEIFIPCALDGSDGLGCLGNY
jgi:hypothetical protein